MKALIIGRTFEVDGNGKPVTTGEMRKDFENGATYVSIMKENIKTLKVALQ